MQDKKLYERLLGIERPWWVREVKLDLEAGPKGTVYVYVGLEKQARLVCPECGAAGRSYDTRERRWRHLDTMLIADVPRVRCKRHGVRQMTVPWAEPRSRLTVLLEALVIDWLKEASFAAVARWLEFSWDQVAGVQDRAVWRGLARRTLKPPREIGVDETAFQRRHEYVTIVNDLDDRVLYVADGRGQEALDGFFCEPGETGTTQIETVAMDMWAPYIKSTQAYAPDAKFVFDKFHIAKHLGDAVD